MSRLGVQNSIDIKVDDDDVEAIMKALNKDLDLTLSYNGELLARFSHLKQSDLVTKDKEVKNRRF